MVSQATTYEHVVLDEKGTAIIEGTNMKVTELVTEMIAYGWSPEEIHFQHPYLGLGQVHSALAYYWDHSEELNREIEQSSERIREKRLAARPSPLVQRLRSKGIL